MHMKAISGNFSRSILSFYQTQSYTKNFRDEMWFRLYTKSNVASPFRFLDLTSTIELHWKVTVEVGRENCNRKAETASGFTHASNVYYSPATRLLQ